MKPPRMHFRAHASTRELFEHTRNEVRAQTRSQRQRFSLLKGQDLHFCPRDYSRGLAAIPLLEGKGERVWPTRRASADLSIFSRYLLLPAGTGLASSRDEEPPSSSSPATHNVTEAHALCFPERFFGWCTSCIWLLSVTG
jgi:hypothetical protein